MLKKEDSSIDAARRALAAQFKAHGIAGAELEARLLVGHVTGYDLTSLTTRGTEMLDVIAQTQLKQMSVRRLTGEPIARILGEQEFWGLRFAVSSATLIPRNDTETLVEAVLDSVRDRTAQLRIADLGTGTGAILIALLTELPNATGVGTDISEQGLQTATANAARYGLSDRTHFILSDYASLLDGAFDMIVSNPPYIRTGDIAHLATEVRDHDPHLALDGGAGGLDAYRIIASQAAKLLVAEGLLAFEIGQGQAADVTAITRAAGLLAAGAPKLDSAGILRVILVRKPRL